MTDPATRLASVQESISSAARLAGREPGAVTLVAVTKTRSREEIEPLLAAGQRHFGENRMQEVEAKWPPIRLRYPDVQVHCIGRLQSNKAGSAIAQFDVIHSLDRPSLLDALVTASAKAGRAPQVYVQVNIGEEAQKGGVALADLPAFLDRVRASPLPLAGLMGMPPIGVEPSPYFALLAKLARRHGVTGLSMGMSGDYRAAVMLGATVVRVGSALFEGPATP